MINTQEVLRVLQVNGFDNTTPMSKVDSILSQLQYNDADKHQMFDVLRNLGWFSSTLSNPLSADETVHFAVPIIMSTPAPEIVSQPVTAVPVAPVIPQSQPTPIQNAVPTLVMPDVPTSPVNQAPSPLLNSMPNNIWAQQTAMAPKPLHSSKKLLISVIVVLLILILVGGGLAYAYTKKIGPFAFSTYTEQNFFTGLLGKFAEVKTSKVNVSGNFFVGARDKDAEPFAIKEPSNAAEIKRNYFNDSKRLSDVSAIINNLNRLVGYSPCRYCDAPVTSSNSKIKVVQNTKTYPAKIDNLIALIKGQNYYNSSGSVSDPVTGKIYEYKVIDGGKNFMLTVNFDTDASIKEIQDNLTTGYVSYDYDTKKTTQSVLESTSTIISSRTVTFTKDSYSYLNMSSTPPKPFMEEMSDSLRTVPTDINVKMDFSVSSEAKENAISDWLFNLNAEGSFGDLTYKVNADAMKKDKNYFFKINNIPSLFMIGDLSAVKGKWVSVSSDIASTTNDLSYDYSVYSEVARGIPEAEKEYKKNKEKAIKFIKKLVTTADEEKLIAFKDTPKTEKVDDRYLTKYNLTIRKEAILSFYKKMADVVNNDPDYSDYKGAIDQGLINYLESDEFNEIFAYFNKNNTLSVWTDSNGYPAIIQNTTRIVPPDTATQLAGKQINIVTKLVISDINKPLELKAPTDAVKIQKLIDDVSQNLNSARAKGLDASIKSSLANMRAQAELVYDDNKESYGKNPFPLGPCKATVNTLFGASGMSSIINGVINKLSSTTATCVSKGTVGKINSWAVSAPLSDKDYSWCVDSTGYSGEIMGAIKKDTCN